MSQLPLNLPLIPSYQEDDFLVSECNQHAWDSLEKWDQEKRNVMLIKGPDASGKTHLTHIWALRNRAELREAMYLDHRDIGDSLFTSSKTLVVENCELQHDQEILFHLLNHCRQHPEHRVLLTMNLRKGWEKTFSLPDLRSRLQALPQAEISQPDDAVLSALLMKSFQDRQIEISETSLNYLLVRMERSFFALYETVEALDQQALIKKQPITRSLIQQVLTKQSKR